MSRLRAGFVAVFVAAAINPTAADELPGIGGLPAFDCPGGSRPPTTSFAALRDWVTKLFALPNFANFAIVDKANLPSGLASLKEAVFWTGPYVLGAVDVEQGLPFPSFDPRASVGGFLQGAANACSKGGGVWTQTVPRDVTYGNLSRTISYAAVIGGGDCRNESGVHHIKIEVLKADNSSSGNLFFVSSDDASAAEKALSLFGWAIASDALSCKS